MPTIMAGSGFRIPNFPIEIDIKPFLINADLLKTSTFRMARQFGDMTWPLTQSVRIVIMNSIAVNFDVMGRPAWPPLTFETLNKKLKSGMSYSYVIYPLLGVTERLSDSAQSRHIWRITRDSADMEALDKIIPYAKYHQQGTKHVPRRQFALLQEKDIEHIVVIFDSWIRQVTSKKDFWPFEHKEF